MITATDAYNASLDALTGLTYIDTLISGATSQGLFSIVVEGNKVTADTIDEIRSNGYIVNDVYPDGNRNFPFYRISWG